MGYYLGYDLIDKYLYIKNKNDIMTQKINVQDFFQDLRKDRSDVLLHDSIKELIQEMIDLIQEEYNKIILNPTCTEYDALEYILLFAIEGCIAASRLGSNMDEYFTAVDIYAGLLGLYGDEMRDQYFTNVENSDTLEQDYEKLKKDKKDKKSKKPKDMIGRLEKELKKGDSDGKV